MVELASTIWADGPSSLPTHPPKAQVRAWGTWIEGVITAFMSNGGLVYASKGIMDADKAHDANTMAWVVGDPIASNNGIYGKVGASGSGSWSRRSDLPFSFIVGSDAGAGTANAIQITTPIPASPSAIIVFTLAQATTGSPVTLSVNGATPVTIKSNRGSNVSGLSAGMDVWGRLRTGELRLLNDQDVSLLVEQAQATLIAATEDLRDQAAASATAAAASATQAQVYANMVGAAVYDFSVDSEAGAPGYDWSE